MRASRRWYLDGTYDWFWRTEWCRRPRAGRRIGRGTGARTCAVSVNWYALRGPYSGRLNVRVSVPVAYENSGGRTGACRFETDGGIEYARRRTRPPPLASGIRSIRMSSTLDWKRECSPPGFGVSGCRVLSTALEHTQSLVFWNTADGSLGARSLGQIGGIKCASWPAFIPGYGPIEANRQPVMPVSTDLRHAAAWRG